MDKHCPTLNIVFPHRRINGLRAEGSGGLPENCVQSGYLSLLVSFTKLFPVSSSWFLYFLAWHPLHGLSVSVQGFHPMLALLPRSARFTALIATQKVFFALLLLYKNISTEDSLGFNFKVSVLVRLEVWCAVKIWL